MPFEFSDCETYSGTPYLRVEASGTVELVDGEAMMLLVRRPGSHGPRVLTVIADGTEYSTEVRKLFPSVEGEFSATATVVNSAIIRAAINLMLRLRVRGDGSPFRMFNDEGSALAWLEQQPLRERNHA